MKMLEFILFDMKQNKTHSRRSRGVSLKLISKWDLGWLLTALVDFIEKRGIALTKFFRTTDGILIDAISVRQARRVDVTFWF